VFQGVMFGVVKVTAGSSNEFCCWKCRWRRGTSWSARSGAHRRLSTDCSEMLCAVGGKCSEV